METNAMQLCDDLLLLLGNLKAAVAAAADKHNLTPQQLYALYAIMQGEATMGRLATILHCDASNVTGIVDRLTARQLVTSEAAPHDRRAKVLKASERGAQIVEDFLADLPVRMGCARMAAAERAQMHEFIAKLTA